MNVSKPFNHFHLYLLMLYPLHKVKNACFCQWPEPTLFKVMYEIIYTTMLKKENGWLRSMLSHYPKLEKLLLW